MSEKILFVDDELRILEGFRRQFGRRIDVTTASSGAEGLALIEESGPFAVVVSDMRMPEMNGSEFLAAVRARYPDTIRIILSGQSDLNATISAVNDGQIFRFVVKPCDSEDLWSVIEAGITQYRLIHAERDVLERTLGGVVKLLMEVLGITNPAAFSRSASVQRYATAIAEALGVSGRWELDMASMLSQLGCITLPEDLLAKVYAGAALKPEEQQLYNAHPAVAGRLISIIPRLEPVAEIVTGQQERPDVSSMPATAAQWDAKPLASFILRAAIEVDKLVVQGLKPLVAIQQLAASWPELSPAIAKALRATRMPAGDYVVREVHLAELTPRMILDEDLLSTTGVRLVVRGQEVNNMLLARLSNIAAGVGLREPFRVRVQS